MNSKHLGIYLNDHLAGSVAGLALAKRSASQNEGTAVGAFLETLVAEIEDDQTSLLDLMGRLDIPRSPWKGPAARLAEIAGRVKLNGSLIGYSNLSRMEELEALILGVRGKLALWRALEDIAPRTPGLERAEMSALAERAERQIKTLEGHHRDAAIVALLDDDLPQRDTEA